MSTGEEEDRIKVTFKADTKRRLSFQSSQNGELALDEADSVTELKIGRQMPIGVATQSLASGGAIMGEAIAKTTLVILLLQTFMQGVMKKLMGALMLLQVVCHLGLLKV